jgi:phosphatidylserine/phosphatidylglycerophosphate/cardiolipin synthase-like enzyme
MQTEAVFENISERIKQELWKAQKVIHIAVAWFTNKELFDILKIKAQNNCKVFIIINDDEINNNSSIPYDSINIKNIKIFKSGIAENELMHNKFCIIDNTTIITGSYNWSYKAQSNFENVIITYNDNILANQFLDEFNNIVRIINPKEALKRDVFPLHIVVKRLEIIKNYILLEDINSLIAESLKLSQYNFNEDISEIIKLVKSDNCNLAIPIIDNFIRQNQQVELWFDKELAILKTEVRKLENQINAFDNEKTELEK